MSKTSIKRSEIISDEREKVFIKPMEASTQKAQNQSALVVGLDDTDRDPTTINPPELNLHNLQLTLLTS